MKEKRPCQCSIPTYWVSGATLRWSDHLVERAALCSTNAWKCAVQWPCWSAFHSECSGGPTLNSIHLKVTGCFVCIYCSSQWNHMHMRQKVSSFFCFVDRKGGVTKSTKWSMNCIFYAFGPREQDPGQNRAAAERLVLMQRPLQARGYSTGQMAATSFQSVLIIFYVRQRCQIA